jgi:hypothetical protein
MNCPIYILYYSNKPNRLFAVEKDGLLMLPIFSEIGIAEKYKNRVCEIHKINNEEIALIINICDNRKQASNLFKALYSDFHFRNYYLNPTDPCQTETEIFPIADLILDLEGSKD